MRVELQRDDNVPIVLDILFWKTAPGERRIVNGKELIDTTCQINIVDTCQIKTVGADDANSKTSPILKKLTCVVARQNPLDNYSKITGKKVALARAIANITFLEPIPQICSINTRRHSSRQHIWNVFHQTFGRWS